MPKNQVAFKGNVVQVGKSVTNNTTKNITKFGIFASITAFFASINSQIEAKKLRKKKKL